MLAVYARGKERFRLGTDTKQKGAKNDLINSGGLNRFMASQPRTNSPFLYNSSLAAHMC